MSHHTQIKLTFLGAAETVTGSKTLVERGRTRVLVDCGLFQGVKNQRLRNRAPFPFEPSALDAVLLTHAHLDHSGALPVLVRSGFRGPIHCTAATAALLRILLPDAARLQAEDADYANRKGFSRHSPAEPLFTEADVRNALHHIKVMEFDEDVRLGDLTARASRAGHILGAASILVQSADQSVLFSGDLGRPDDLMMPPPEPPPAADCLVMESTYGDRRHDDVDAIATLGDIVRRTVERGGSVLVPAFAVGRAQTLLYALSQVFERGLAPRVDVHLDSPMASSATEVHARFRKELRISPADWSGATARVHCVTTPDESKKLSRSNRSRVIVSASGMLTGGRVLHHLKALGPERENTILLVGYQVPGTRGAALRAPSPEVKIHGQYVRIHAEVASLDGFSGHADQAELLQWIASGETRPKQVFLNHGEPAAADALRRRIRDEFKIPTRVAQRDEVVVLE